MDRFSKAGGKTISKVSADSFIKMAIYSLEIFKMVNATAMAFSFPLIKTKAASTKDIG